MSTVDELTYQHEHSQKLLRLTEKAIGRLIASEMHDDRKLIYFRKVAEALALAHGHACSGD